MSDHKELCEALQEVAGKSKGATLREIALFRKARDLIEAQAARIAELEAAGVMTAVVITIDGREYGVHPNVAAYIKAIQAKAKRIAWNGFEATGPIRLAISHGFNGGWTAHSWTQSRPFELGKFATESEARAACQQEFDRIFSEMTEQGT